jgi:uncharacterized protein with GYD domain
MRPRLASELGVESSRHFYEEDRRMAMYVVLLNWTEQGIKDFKDSPGRADAGKEEMAKLGVTLKEIYWTVGQHDLVLLCDSPDDESIAAALLRLGSAGNVRSTTLRAFTREEFNQVAARAR